MCELNICIGWILSSFPREETEVYLGTRVFYQKDSSVLKLGVSGKLQVCLRSLGFHMKLLI